MGLIDFLEGAYRGGRLLFLLYDHDKQVKLRYKTMKGRGVKRLSSTTDNITRLREITPVNRPLVNWQSSYSSTRDVLEDEIKASLAQGFEVNVRNDSIEVLCLRTNSFEWRFITDHDETPTKLRMINQMKDNLIKRRALLRSTLPNSDNRALGYADFGEIGHMVGEASESLLRAAKLRKQQQELSRKEYHFLTENLEMETSTRKNEQWFLDRIGKTVYRNPNGCHCDTCKRIGVHGLTIVDRLHALYLYDIQCEYEAEGITLNYRDEK